MSVIFQTARLTVRRLEHGDLDAMVAVYGNADAMRFVDDGSPLPRDRCREWIDVTHANYEKRGYGMFAVVQNETAETIGFCGLVHPGNQEDAEIKYAFLQERWGLGYATETARGMLDYAAQELGLDRVIATAAPANHASHRVLEKSQMTRSSPRDDGTLVFERALP